MRLKELRLEKNLSQWDVANGIKTGQSNIGRWEKEEVLPSSENIIKLADFFGVSTDYLLGRSDDFGYVTVQNSPAVPVIPKLGKISEIEVLLILDFRKLPAQTQDYIRGITHNLVVNS